MTHDVTENDEPMLSVADDWEDFALIGGKVERKSIRRLSGILIKVGIRPVDLDQPTFEIHVFPYHTACIDPNHATETRCNVNSFTHAFNGIGKRLSEPMHKLSGIDNSTDLQRRAKAAFEEKFSAELTLYKMKRDIKTSLRWSSDLNGLFNCYEALKNSNINICSICDLLIEENIVVIQDHYDLTDQKGAYLQALTVLAHLALQNDDQKLREEILERARGLRKSPALSKKEIRALIPYFDNDLFFSRARAVLEVGRDAEQFSIFSTRGAAHPIASAIAILMMIFAPASFEIIYLARFEGPNRETKHGLRPTLTYKSSEDSVEASLDETIRGLIDDFYESYRQSGISMTGICSEPDGSLRSKSCAVRSIEATLDDLEVNLTVLQLRDLGVMRAMLAGVPSIQMARAARISERFIKERFEPIEALIKDIQRDK